MFPFGIERGLWLEDRDILLAWRTSPDQLRRDHAPDIVTVSGQSPPATSLCWKHCLCLGGLSCEVTTVFGASWFPQVSLRGLRLAFHCLKEPQGSMRASFEWLQPQLVERLGPPAWVRQAEEEGEAGWRFGDVTLRYAYNDYLFVADHSGLLFLQE